MSQTLELGQWVVSEDGLGQVLSLHKHHRESFEEAFHGEKVGQITHVFAICKILCDFSGKIRKNKLLKVYQTKHIKPVSQDQKQLISHIQIHQVEAYQRYLFYDEKPGPTNSISLLFKVGGQHFKDIDRKIKEIRQHLPHFFRFKAFKKAFRQTSMPFELENYLRYGTEYSRDDTIQLVFHNHGYKTIGKEKIFDAISVIYF